MADENYGIFSGGFTVPTEIVDKYLKLAPEGSVKVLLFLLRNSGKSFSCSDIASGTGVSEDVVKESFIYWDVAGLSLSGTNCSSTSYKKQAPVAETSSVKTVKISENVRKVTSVVSKPDRSECAKRIDESSDIAFMLQHCSQFFPKGLSQSVISTLIYLHDYHGLSCEVIVMMLGYCNTVGLTRISSIERECLSLIEGGNYTFEGAENYIKKGLATHKYGKKVLAMFSIDSRRLSAKESLYVTRWFVDFKFSDPLILEAYNRCVDAIGKLRFAYIDKILATWHEAGIKNMSDLVRLDSKNKKQKTGQKGSNSIDMSKIVSPNMSVPKYVRKGPK